MFFYSFFFVGTWFNMCRTCEFFATGCLWKWSSFIFKTQRIEKQEMIKKNLIIPFQSRTTTLSSPMVIMFVLFGTTPKKKLVGAFNPFWKLSSQFGSFSQVRVKPPPPRKKILQIPSSLGPRAFAPSWCPYDPTWEKNQVQNSKSNEFFTTENELLRKSLENKN